MEIRTIEDLLKFVDTNFNKLSNEQYVELCSHTMNLYEYRKPHTKEKALERINKLYAFAQNYTSVHDMPLFLD